MTEKLEYFLVNITIIECRHLAWPNMDSAVDVKVDNQRQCTEVHYNDDSPFFNEYFTFEFFTSIQDLMDKSIVLTVIQPRKVWTAKKILGHVTLDVALVWAQADHQFYHKWAAIAAPSDDPTGGPRGYIKVDIHILRKGETPKIPNIDPHETDEIEGNLLLPEGITTERQRAHYVFKIYRGENLCRGKYMETTSSVSPDKDPLNAYIEVFFAGLKGRTSLKKNESNPVWNESLTLKELFPPLCQRIKIRLCCSDTFQDTVIAVRYINLRSISNDGEQGFLPTFGPTFLHFYAKGTNIEGYVGKILLSFNTEIQLHSYPVAKAVDIESISPLAEINLWKDEMVLLYGIIFNSNLIDRKFSDKSISYEINFGLSELQKNVISSDGGPVSYRTPERPPISNGKIYWSLEYGQDKPCVFMQSYWPDFRKRLFLSNMISKIVDAVKLKLQEIEDLFIKGEYKFSGANIETLLLNTIDYLSNSCKRCIHIAQGNNVTFQTDLDKERKRFCLHEINNVVQSLSDIYNPKMKKQCFEKLQTLVKRAEMLVEDAQDCWPDIYIVMISGTKKISWRKCPVKDVVYSAVEEERGVHCGKIQSLFLKPNAHKSLFSFSSTPASASCELDIFLWVGLEKDKDACLKAFPEGFVPPGDLGLEVLPPYLVAQHKYYFQCRVHVYQGKFVPGSDRSGLCDPFARVVIGSECRETAVAPATLNPTWDQTLTYNQIILYGEKSRIKSDPPLVIVEVYDQDEYFQVEYIGHCTFKPIIKFREDPYAAPQFPPTLQWYNVCNNKEVMGEIFIVAEMLEIPEIIDKSDLKPTNEIVKIPSEIKPQLLKYRIEVMFWGVRELQKIFFLSVTKPKITIECAYKTLHSETITNTQQTLNFNQPIKSIDVNLPDQEDLSPPLCIKLFDCRSFGRYTLVGTQVINVKYFISHPMIKEERNQMLLKIPSLESSEQLNIKKQTVRKKKDLNKKKNREKLKKIKNIYDDNISGSVKKLKMHRKKKKIVCADKNENGTVSARLDALKQEHGDDIQVVPCEKQIKQLYKHKRKDKETSSSKSSSPRLHSPTKTTKKKKNKKQRNDRGKKIKQVEKHTHGSEDQIPEEKTTELNPSVSLYSATIASVKSSISSWLRNIYEKPRERIRMKKRPKEEKDEKEEELTEEHDWWTRYYASVEVHESKGTPIRRKKKCTLTIYPKELEAQPEFEEFTDTLQNFKLYKGKRTGDESVDETNITAIFKGSLKIYEWPQDENLEYVTKQGFDVNKGYFQNFPHNTTLNFVLRIYCIKAMNLRPKDIGGKSDPYIVIKMSDSVINDRSFYVPKQVNPIFGRCFELKGKFPHDHAIIISIWDWDLTSADDLIGETKIDIENRFYSKHRAHCGISVDYYEMGNCAWRDAERPTRILENLCKMQNISQPAFGENSVKIVDTEFHLPAPKTESESSDIYKEKLALCALRRWSEIPLIGYSLVPEHVETRSLYHPSKLGVEQGKLQLWIDIFPIGDFPPPKQVDITPRKPVAYELRVIIWNTEDVILDEDDFFLGEKISDIYVKSWITGPNESQHTDVHYRSMTGEGSFNWRFIFPFKYLSTENKLVLAKKDLFSIDETEIKMPCKLTLQVWDNDTFSEDDFLGTVTLELAYLPRGAKTAKMCSLENLEPHVPTVNLFRTKRTRGWWPCRGIDKETKAEILGGKIEAELELVTVEEAEKHPVGLGRSEPHPLPKPNRPDTSLSWLRNPLKAFKFLICKQYKWKIIKYTLLIFLMLGVLLAVYSLPGYTVKKMLHV